MSTTHPTAPTSDAATIIDTMRQLHGVNQMTVIHGGTTVPLIALPKGLELHDPMKYIRAEQDEIRNAPKRRTGTAVMTDLPSFIAHVRRFADADTAIFAMRNETSPSLTGVLDYHRQTAEGAPRFGKHRTHYAFPLSVSWQAWAEVDGKPMSQADFAAFLEEQVMDIMAPPTDGRGDAGALALDLVSMVGGSIAGPTTMLETARGLRIVENSEVANAQNLATGEVEMVFRTEHKDGSGQKLNVPTLFVIQTPVFDGGAAYRVPIRVRYRKREGTIIWFMTRYRPDLVFVDAFDQAVKQVRDETGLPVLMGTPESAN